MQQQIDADAVKRIEETVRSHYVDMIEGIADEKFEEAEAHLEALRELSGLAPDDADVMRFRAIIAIQRGRAHDFLQELGTYGEGPFPELRAMCLYSLQDPLWEGLAESLVDDDDPRVAESMRALLEGYRAAINAS